MQKQLTGQTLDSRTNQGSVHCTSKPKECISTSPPTRAHDLTPIARSRTCKQQAAQATMSNISEVTTVEAFQLAAAANEKLLVFFWAHWSQPCKALDELLPDVLGINPDVHCVKVCDLCVVRTPGPIWLQGRVRLNRCCLRTDCQRSNTPLSPGVPMTNKPIMPGLSALATPSTTAALTARKARRWKPKRCTS